MEKVRLAEIRNRISWGSVMAGVITVLAISVLLSILGSSIGLFMFDPTSGNPTSGIGTTVGIWTALAAVASLAAGGFIAGKLAGRDGIIHGFLVWATTLIVTVILGAWLLAGTVKVASNVLGSVFSVTGDVLSGAGNLLGDGASELSDQVGNIFGGIDFNSETDRQEVRRDVREALRRSGVREFQPEYLENQTKEIRNDLSNTVKRIATNPNDADRIINGFTDRLQQRADRFASNVDREDIVRAIANNSDLSRAEVDRAADEYIELFNRMRTEGTEQINNLQQTVEQAKVELENMKQDALQAAEDASNAAARSALLSFFAILIGAVLCAFCGNYGSRKTWEGYDI